MGFARFSSGQGVTDSNGEKLYWGRASIDGAPFRGQAIPLLKAEEAERVLERSRDVLFGTFNTSEPETKIHGRTLRDILEGCANDWFELVHKTERWWDPPGGAMPVVLVYIEWAEPYMMANSEINQHNTTFIPCK